MPGKGRSILSKNLASKSVSRRQDVSPRRTREVEGAANGGKDIPRDRVSEWADEPLRSLAPQDLQLDDFRINPKTNEGFDYAFNDTVRIQGQRVCLPGCTRPECCGNHFRKIIELGGALPTIRLRRGLWDSSPPGSQDQSDEDRLLLEWYLGDYSGRLKSMN